LSAQNSASGGGGQDTDDAVQTFISALNLTMDEAKSLVNAGYKGPEDLAKISVSAIQAIGISKRRAEEIKLLATLIRKSGNETEVEQQERSEETGEKPVAEMDALKKWLTGSDDALMEWLGDKDAAAGSQDQAARSVDGMTSPASTGAQGAPSAVDNEQIANMKRDIEDLRNSLKSRIGAIDEKGFDPLALIEENAQLNMHLQSELRKRKELEQGLEDIKTGSMSAIKYVKGQKRKEQDDVAKSLQYELVQTKLSIKTLEEKLKVKEEQVTSLREKILKKVDAKPDTKELKRKEMELVDLEAKTKEAQKMVEVKEQELRDREAKMVGDGSSDDLLRKRFEDELSMKNVDWEKRENEFKKTIVQLEEESQRARIELKLKKEYDELRGGPGATKDQISDKLRKREEELISKEKSITVREQEIARLREELDDKTKELDRVKEPVKFKEEELSRREQDLIYRENLIQAEKKKFDAIKMESSSVDEHEAKRRLEDLERDISRKEQIVKEKEKYLRAKEEELRHKTMKVVDAELEFREEDIKIELKTEKVKTGTPRLDDLLFGGAPIGSAVLVHGPPFSGKDVLSYGFLAEGMNKGIPCIVVLTDMTPAQFKDEMMFVNPSFEAYETKGLVHYIDIYSPTLGEYTKLPYTSYVDKIDDTESLMGEVDAVSKEIKKKYPYYRMLFKSISTLISYLDTKSVFKFLQPFVGKRKNERAVSFFLIEKGMHSDSDIQMIGAIMDGEFDIKIDQLRPFIRVNGLCDVQSRAFIEYSFSKSGVQLKSFSLGHIR